MMDEPQVASDSADIEDVLPASQISVDDHKDEQAESNTDSEMTSQPEGRQNFLNSSLGLKKENFIHCTNYF